MEQSKHNVAHLRFFDLPEEGIYCSGANTVTDTRADAYAMEEQHGHTPFYVPVKVAAAGSDLLEALQAILGLEDELNPDGGNNKTLWIDGGNNEDQHELEIRLMKARAAIERATK